MGTARLDRDRRYAHPAPAVTGEQLALEIAEPASPSGAIPYPEALALMLARLERERAGRAA